MLGRSADERLLRKALALYAGEHVLAYVLAKGESGLVPDQETHDLTILFVDVANLKEPSQGIVSNRLREWQSAYLDIVSGAVIKASGTLDTFIGDGACAWWDHNQSGDVAHACRAAVEIVRGIQDLNQLAATRGYPIMTLKMGIHTGKAAVGPYGSKDRLRFGIVGDAVNLASRLCDLSSSTYPEAIILSGATQKRLPPEFVTTPLDRIHVKGREEPLAIYALGPLGE